MRFFQEAFGPKGAAMRNWAFFVAAPDGRAFPMQLREGLCLVVFGRRENARKWMRAILPEPYRSECRVGVWKTKGQVQAWYRREGHRFDVVSTNPDPDPRAQVFYDPITQVLEIAREEATS